MKTRILLVTALITLTSAFFASAASPASRKAHAAAHRSQLANVSSKIDKSVLNDFIQRDIKAREEKAKSSSSRSPETEQLVADLLLEARTHLGAPYSHGSKGPNRFDCSGFSSYVYRQFGVNLSSSSRAQFTQGRKVERKDLKKGDLVFFTSRSSGGGVGHVGIVTEASPDGNFKFIHASIKGVKISSCSGYYEGRYLGGRRIFE